jgi:hypothetical protein
MPSALVKLLNSPGLFRITAEHSKKVRAHPQDKMCMLVDAGELIGLKDGEPIEGTVINANQTVLIKPNVPLTASKYHALVSYNPQLSLHGAIVSPVSPIVRPGEEDMIGLMIRASKKLDLADIGHVFELYQID